jgi:hypothetical protein
MTRQASGNRAHQPSQHNHDDGDSDFAEKDATEIELERLVFGDESGFREGLKSHRRYSSEPIPEENDHLEGDPHGSKGEREARDSEGLEGVDDADVGIDQPILTPRMLLIARCSFSSLTLGPLEEAKGRWLLRMWVLHKLPKRQHMRLCGKIATTRE